MSVEDNVVEMDQPNRFHCEACGTKASCDCEKPYVAMRPGEAVRRYFATHPDTNLSDFAIAEIVGVSQPTVLRNRPTNTNVLVEDDDAATEPPKRIGKDGKARGPRKKRDPNAPKKAKATPKRERARQIIREKRAAGASTDSHALEAEFKETEDISHVTFDQARSAEDAANEARKEVVTEVLTTQAAVDAELLKEPLSATAQRKLEAYERRVRAQIAADLNAQFEAEVQKRVDHRIAYRDKDEAELVDQINKWHSHTLGYSARRKPFTNDEFRLILAVLHPDANPSHDRRQKAFDTFKKAEFLLRAPENTIKITPFSELIAKRRGRRS